MGVIWDGRGELIYFIVDWVDPRHVWMEEGIKASGMQDVKEFYVEISNLTSYSVRHYSMINVVSFISYHSQYLVSNFNVHMEVAYSIWSARDILKAQVENVIQSLIPGSRYH